MNDRQEARLGDLADIQVGFAFKSKDFSNNNEVRLLRGDNISQGTLKWDSAKFWPRDSSIGTRYVLNPGDLVVAMDRPWVKAGLKYATVSKSDLPAYLVQRVARIRSNPGTNQRYLSYVVGSSSFCSYILSVQTGTSVPHISGRQIADYVFLAHNASEQQAIAEVLGALDDKIAANNRLVETASQLSDALFKESLADSAATEAKISEVCAVVARGITPKYSEAEDSMIVLNQKCVRQQRISLKQARRTELSKVREEKILLHNDVLVNSTGQGTLGRVARWTSPERVTADSHITILRFDPSLVNPVCGGFAVLRSEKVITAMAEGSTGQTELSRRELGKLALLLPPAEVQDSLGQKLSEITEYSDALTQENQRLSGTRDALLPLLMSGKIRVREAEAVVEDVL